MKKLTITILLIVLQLALWSQGAINIGIKYGANSSSMLTNFDEVLVQNIEESNITSYHAGAFVRINAGRIFIQPEAYFNTKGGIIKPIGDMSVQIPSVTNFEYQTIDVPLLLGFKVICRELINLRLYAGPVLTYVTANSLYSEISDLRNSDLNQRYTGWQLGTGIDIWFITLDARIENSANVLANESKYSAANRVYLLSAGIKLF